MGEQTSECNIVSYVGGQNIVVDRTPC